MKKKILKYHLEIFTAIVLLMTVINALLFKHLSDARKIITLFLLLGVLHECDEKRFPGGLFDLMAKKFGMQFSKDKLGKAGCIVVSYWLLITLIPFVFDQHVFLLLIPVVLNFFEAFIHTAGIIIHKLKKPYTPGMLSGWLMAIASAIVVAYLERNALISASDYVAGAALMFSSFLLMDVAIFHAAGMTLADVKQRIAALRKK